jgi:5-methylcytosine-specific restriction protein A
MIGWQSTVMATLPPNKRFQWQPDPPKRKYQLHKERTHLYDTPGWRAIRLAHLKQEPLCRICKAAGRVTPATIVDHIEPVNDGGDFWNENNHQSVCGSCHARKSAKEGHEKRKHN